MLRGPSSTKVLQAVALDVCPTGETAKMDVCPGPGTDMLDVKPEPGPGTALALYVKPRGRVETAKEGGVSSASFAG